MRWVILLVLFVAAFARDHPPRIHTTGRGYEMYCLGECDHVHEAHHTKPMLGMFGGAWGPYDCPDYPETCMPAYRQWLENVNGGDVVVLTDYTDDECDYYNPFFYDLDEKVKSVTTFCFWNRTGSFHKEVAKRIEKASGLWFTGGDQSDYYNFFKQSPVSTAISKLVALGRPIGGQSAGLAIQGEFLFAALYDTVYSDEALANPFNEMITLRKDLFHFRCMQEIITDSHFYARDRLGRLLVFMARIMGDGWVKDSRAKAVGVDEGSAFLLDQTNCHAKLIGDGPNYVFTGPRHKKPEVLEPETPLTWSGPIHVWRWRPTDADAKEAWFDFKAWRGHGGSEYDLSVQDGVVISTQPDGSIY